MRVKHLTLLILSSIFLLTACGNNSQLYTTSTEPEETLSSNSSTEEESTSEQQTLDSDLLSETNSDSSEEENSSKDSTSSEAPTAATAATTTDGQTLPVEAQSAILYNCTDGIILASKNEENLVYPGSTAKLMTALLAVEHVPLDTIITIGDELDLVKPHSSLDRKSVV